MAATCNFQSSSGAGALLAGRAAQMIHDLRTFAEPDQIAALSDSRPLHRALFAGLAPPDWPDAPGTWRGTPGTSVEHAPRAVFLARRLPGLRYRDDCLPAAQVPAAMAALAASMQMLWTDRPGADQTWRDAGFAALADLTARFFAIHPYMDGNGHIWRLTLPLLAARLGLQARPEWTIHQRPYGQGFSLALQWHPDHPGVLADHLRRWFAL